MTSNHTGSLDKDISTFDQLDEILNPLWAKVTYKNRAGP